ncbi:MFS transporter [Bacillus altitudinis]|uniref:MFS transporter n=1 Tax=Bacillus TaxID=1386 RepID=UPI00156A425F|nr:MULTISPECIES: MFS transporter [Bacillus]MCL6797149.1 MFS transporter [Bacillus altitudinis]MCS3485647.1 MFS family permease [Bacillus sp. JUb11]MEC0967916.1 MFS transporter [Bacillus altitudinis]MEC1001705.1 MFS transporter [Bacillus altitudinis]NQD48867.1 MFS transporter [Bacillus altitudinis]
MGKKFWFYTGSKSLLMLSDIVFVMTITFVIYQDTQSATYAALFPLIRTLCQLLAGLLSPVLTDRFQSYHQLKWLPLARLVMLIVFTAQFPFFQQHIVWLFGALILISMTGGFISPLLQAIMPILVQANQLVQANSTASIFQQIVQIAGYSFTGMLVLWIGPTYLLGFTCLMIACSYLFFVPVLPLLKRENTTQRTNQLNSFKDGWTIIWKNKTVRTLTFMDVSENIAGAIWIGAITLAFVTHDLNESEDWWGFINAAYYAGAIIGGLLAAWMSRLIQKQLLLSMAAGSFIYAGLTILFAMNTLPWLALLLCILMGPAYQIRDVSQQTILQTETPIHDLSKVYAAHYVLSSVSVGLSIFFVGMIADAFGARFVYLLGGLFVLICSGIAITTFMMQKKRAAV